MTSSHTRMPATDRRNQLIEVAIDLFSRKGFGGTTTKEIAAAAGVTEAIIFRHFATKQELYKAILDVRCAAPDAEAWFSETKYFMENNDDEGLFRLIVSKIVECSRNDPRFERLMLHAALDGNELALMHHNQFALPIGAQLTEYIARRQHEGAIRDCEPRAVLFAVAGIAQFYASQKYLFQSAGLPLADGAIVDAFVGILMNGLTKGFQK